LDLFWNKREGSNEGLPEQRTSTQAKTWLEWATRLSISASGGQVNVNATLEGEGK
jgi:hypothetical protein